MNERSFNCNVVWLEFIMIHNWNWILFKIQDMKAVNFSIRTWEEMRILSFYLSVFSSFLHFKKKAILCQVKRKEFAILHHSGLSYFVNSSLMGHILDTFAIEHIFWAENTLCIWWRRVDFDHERTTCIKKERVQQKCNTRCILNLESTGALGMQNENEKKSEIDILYCIYTIAVMMYLVYVIDHSSWKIYCMTKIMHKWW